MQSRFNNLHYNLNPEEANDQNDNTSNPAGPAATSDLPSGSVPGLEDQIKQLNLALAAQQKQLAASSNKEAAVLRC